MSQPLFGLVPAGQPVLTTPTETPTPTSFLYAIPPGPKPFSHIVVFLLPGIALPPDTAAAIYLVTPSPTQPAQPDFKFLGGIGPGKESAIFKLSPTTASGVGGNVVLGISVEGAAEVAGQMAEGQGALVPAGAAGAKGPATTLVLAQRIIKNAFNFLASFSGTTPGQVEVVPLRAFEEWWRRFEARIQSDPGFLERED